MGPEALAQVLSALPPIRDPKVLVGTSTGDDAAVYRISADLAVVQTVDFFPPIVDDAYRFGAIAAANSLSDVYAMGADPIFALNIVGFPGSRPEAPLSLLSRILQGGADKASEAGIAIIGGHSVDDNEPKYGLSVTGTVHPDRIWRNVGAQPGDRLILTKAIGTGIIATATRKQVASAEAMAASEASMLALNRDASLAARALDVHACTDITGFGLLGHLREMIADGRVGAEICFSAIPLLAGARELAEMGHLPGGSRRNMAAVAPCTSYDDAVSEVERVIACDAQTSGGLLFALPEAEVAKLRAALPVGAIAADIGAIVADAPGRIHVTKG